MTDRILGTATAVMMLAVATLAGLAAVDCALRGMLDNAAFDGAVMLVMLGFGWATWRDVKKSCTAPGQRK